MDTLNIAKQAVDTLASISEHKAKSGEQIIKLWPIIGPILGLFIGFALGIIKESFFLFKKELKAFKLDLIKYGKGELGIIEIQISYSNLSKRQKARITIEDLLTAKIDDIEKEIEKIIQSF